MSALVFACLLRCGAGLGTLSTTRIPAFRDLLLVVVDLSAGCVPVWSVFAHGVWRDGCRSTTRTVTRSIACLAPGSAGMARRPCLDRSCPAHARPSSDGACAEATFCFAPLSILAV